MSYSSTEQQDAERVNEALVALFGGELGKADVLLTHVAQNAPDNYVHHYEDGASLVIKFWDEDEFIHYVAWQKEHGADRGVTWRVSAYPRAWYYLGFLRVKMNKFSEALWFLERGRKLEPTNPRFLLEIAHVLARVKELDASLKVYSSISKTDPFTTAKHLGAAKRGRGMVLIDLGKLDEAEAAFNESLQWDPASELARNELKYIEHIRSGGQAADAEVIMNVIKDRKCMACGKPMTDGYVLNGEDGRTLMICEACGAHSSIDKTKWSKLRVG